MEKIILSVMLFLLGLSLIIFNFALEDKRKKTSILSDLKKKKNKKTEGFNVDAYINQNKLLKAFCDSAKEDLDILDNGTEPTMIVKWQIALGLFSIIISIYLKNITAFFPLFLVLFSMPRMYLDIKVKKRLKLYTDQILESFQVFLTEFTTTNNVYKSLINTSTKIKYPLRSEYEKLYRELSSGKDYEECFLGFAKRTRSKWTMLFVQMLITHYREGGNFSPHLLTITQEINAENLAEQQNSTELSGVRGINFLLNGLTPIVFIANKIMNPQDAIVFTTTPTGKTIITVAIISATISLYIGKKISDY